jgi:hypothetical protein
MSLLSEVLTSPKLSNSTLVYFQERFRIRLHELVLQAFAACEATSGLTKAEIARRLEKDPAQITRWLGAPGNLTTDTISDLLLAMGCEPNLGVAQLKEQDCSDENEPDWLAGPTQQDLELSPWKAPVFPLRRLEISTGATTTDSNGGERVISNWHGK